MRGIRHQRPGIEKNLYWGVLLLFLSTTYYKDDQIMKVEMVEECSIDNRDKEYIIALAGPGSVVGVATA
jgi:hypothetical protein